ncbi:unnamed protein product [Ectocarpus sp. CCAP 1310/34]|nr:unnamed protein product [Ectocarpus sp. CCAP 1310/34]
MCCCCCRCCAAVLPSAAALQVPDVSQELAAAQVTGTQPDEAVAASASA